MTGAYFVGFWDNGTISSYDSKTATLRYPSGAIFKGIFNSYGPIYGTITYKSGNSFTGDKFKYLQTYEFRKMFNNFRKIQRFCRI